jgi:hypothetical protein
VSEGLGLNLAGADLTDVGFDALPSATYHCSIVKLELRKTKGGGNSVLPAGTPMVNVQVKVEQETVEDADGNEVKCKNRRFFRSLIIAPAKVNGKNYEHKKTMDRMVGQFFKCLGYNEDEILSGDFNPDFDEQKGKELLVTVGQKTKYGTDPDDEIMDNEVKGFRPYGGDRNASPELV